MRWNGMFIIVAVVVVVMNHDGGACFLILIMLSRSGFKFKGERTPYVPHLDIMRFLIFVTHGTLRILGNRVSKRRTKM